jgi:hypothetical protein
MINGKKPPIPYLPPGGIFFPVHVMERSAPVFPFNDFWLHLAIPLPPHEDKKTAEGFR